MVAHALSVETFYVAETAMGLVYGIHLVVDQALVDDVADHLLAS
ncbi:hypothetical protein BKA01_002931 [Pseudonocardia eucalypti]|nr:hypothetical protein [Pseudonocardia eucalypti]